MDHNPPDLPEEDEARRLPQVGSTPTGAMVYAAGVDLTNPDTAARIAQIAAWLCRSVAGTLVHVFGQHPRLVRHGSVDGI